MAMKEYALKELLIYEQPTNYIVESTDYRDEYETPVLTAGKSFVLGYTNETEGIFDKLPVIIFDDFTTATQFVNFKFKVKSSAMKILHINQDLVLPKYIYYRLQIIQFDHSTHKRYWIQKYSKIKISIPPIEEQERIVEKIEELFSELNSGIDTISKIKNQIGLYRQAMIESAIKESIKQGAVEKPFGSYVLNYQNGIAKRKGTGENTPVLRLADVKNGVILKNNEFRCIGLSEKERERNLLDKGDLLIIRVNGSESNVGRPIIVNKDRCYAACDHFIRCKVDNTRILTEYADIILNSFYARKHIKENMVSSAGQNTISQGTLSSISVYVPDIATQERIVRIVKERCSLCDNIEETISMTLAQSEAIRQGILKNAFEGRL